MPGEARGNLPLIIVLLFVVYAVCFLWLTSGNLRPQMSLLSAGLLITQLLCAFLLMWLIPLEFLPILTIIWAAVIPFYSSLTVSALLTLLVLVVWFTIYGMRWSDDDLVLSALLYGTFHLFALFANHQTRVAEQATEESNRLNKELQAAQNLLEQATRQNERSRIARDLHDLLGHHLTALIINLQVAGHITEGEAKAKVEQCHALAKLLLSDVREAVTTLRENQSLDFPKMVDLMIENVPGLKVNSNIDTELDLEELSLAKTLLSCIQEGLTNSLRHSGGTEFCINMKRQDNNLILELYDNGQVNNRFVKGNGLKGLEERVTELGGSVEFGRIAGALQIRTSIPL
jgi:signal transduction histidine kinase